MEKMLNMIQTEMFLNTLGLNEWMVRNWVNTAVHGLPGKIIKTNSTHSLSTESDNISP